MYEKTIHFLQRKLEVAVAAGDEVYAADIVARLNAVLLESTYF